MALATCRSCEHQIAKNAEVCPACGDTDPLRKKRNIRVFAFIALLVLSAYAWFILLPDIRAHGLFPEITRYRQ